MDRGSGENDVWGLNIAVAGGRLGIRVLVEIRRESIFVVDRIECDMLRRH